MSIFTKYIHFGLAKLGFGPKKWKYCQNLANVLRPDKTKNMNFANLVKVGRQW